MEQRSGPYVLKGDYAAGPDERGKRPQGGTGLRQILMHMDMELVLYRAFLEADLPAPNIRIEVPVGDDPNIVRWFYNLVCALAPRVDEDELAASGIGDLETLESRLEAERVAARSFGASVALVGAWSRKPG